MPATFWITVSDLAVCQRCPVLFGYHCHMGKTVWPIGIKGNGYAYGSMFHKNIAQVFFEAASDRRNYLHREAASAVSGGEALLEEFVRTRIFMPFMEKASSKYDSGQIMALAKGVTVWVKAMADFFAEIPSLKRDPSRNMGTIFLEPEQKMRAYYVFPGGDRLGVVGCYDALMFNPDKAEARLFEFKGYTKSDIAVPLSQSMVYSWLVWKLSGIIPSVEVIYLDDKDREPCVFDSQSVKGMMRSGLPGLFDAAFNTITLRRLPEIVKDKKLCSACKFRGKCDSDWEGRFGKRKGASMLNVLVFFMLSMMVTANMFFFSHTSSETMAVRSEAMQKRFAFERYLYEAVQAIKNSTDPMAEDYIGYKAGLEVATVSADPLPTTNAFSARTFYSSGEGSGTAAPLAAAVVYDLGYTFYRDDDYINTDDDTDWKNQSGQNVHKLIFPARGSGYYLVRIYEPSATTNRKRLMYQLLVKKDGTNTPEIKSFQEVWY